MHRLVRVHLLLAALALTACAGPARATAPLPTLPPTGVIPTLAAPATAAPSPTPLPSPTPGPRVFTIALATLPGTLDPANAEDESALLITRHLYEGLTMYAPGTTRAQPALAESWEPSPNGFQWTFHLRAGVTFSDGSPLTAEIARQNVERWRTHTPAGRYAFWRLMFGGFAGETDETGAPLATVAAVTATAPNTLVLSLNRPDAELPNTLAMPSFALVNPAAWASPDFGQPAAGSAGTGPFMLAEGSTSQLVTLARNPRYWGTPAQPDALLFKIIPDDAQRLIALQVGEVDGLARLNPAHYNVADQWPIRVDFDPALEVLYLGFNQAHAPWGDGDCRRAVAAALDKARYAREFFPGDAEAAGTLTPPAVWGYSAPASPGARDLAGARALWKTCLKAQTGVLPKTYTLYVPPIARTYLPDPARLGAALQADLAEAGISVTVTSPDWTTRWLPAVQGGQADLFLLGWSGVNGDPGAYWCPLLCGEDAAFNSDRQAQPIPPDAELAQVLREADRTSDPVQRLKLYAQAQARFEAALPAVPLTWRKTAWAFRADLQGVVPSPIESVFFNLKVKP